MASFTLNKNEVEQEFSLLNIFFNELQSNSSNLQNVNLEILSMGMSGDYDLAIKNGSNMIRVGSAIFGNRNY